MRRHDHEIGASSRAGWLIAAGSTSRTALRIALDGAAASGADAELIWVRELGLPLYSAEHDR